MKMAPLPGWLAWDSRPPWALTITEQMLRPMRRPPGLAVKYGSKSCCAVCASMPGPLSLRRTPISFPWRRNSMWIPPPTLPGFASASAWMASMVFKAAVDQLAAFDDASGDAGVFREQEGRKVVA